MKLSIVIPVYNEVKTIHKIIEKVESLTLPVEKEIILVDDFSTDGTRDLLKKLPYNVFFHEKNMGKGAALRTGFKNATGDIFVVQDADLEYNPEDWINMLKLIGKYDVIYGSRFLNQKFGSKQRWGIPTHYIGNTFLSLLTSILYGSWITDMETCYKMFTRKAYTSLKLTANKFDIEPQFTSQFLKNGFKIKEISITYNPRSFDDGKKINWKDGVGAIKMLIRERFKN